MAKSILRVDFRPGPFDGRARIRLELPYQGDEYDDEEREVDLPPPLYPAVAGAAASAATRGAPLAAGDLPRQIATLEQMEAIGDELFQQIIAPARFAEFRNLCNNPETADLRFRLNLREAPNSVSAIAWEAMRLPDETEAGATFLALNPRHPIVRQIDRLESDDAGAAAREGPLQVLIAIAVPQHDLDANRELLGIKEALERIEAAGRFEFRQINPATRKSLDDEMARKPDIVHFIGHGGTAGKLGAIQLLTQDGTGTVPLTSRDFRMMMIAHGMDDESRSRLVLLNSCWTAKVQPDRFAGMAQNLIAGGIDHVVAMQFPITDASAIAFASGFYAALAEGLPVDSSVCRGRHSIYVQDDERARLEFVTPVIYSRREYPAPLLLRPGKPAEPAPPVRIQLSPEQIAALADAVVHHPGLSGAARPARSGARGWLIGLAATATAVVLAAIVTFAQFRGSGPDELARGGRAGEEIRSTAAGPGPAIEVARPAARQPDADTPRPGAAEPRGRSEVGTASAEIDREIARAAIAGPASGIRGFTLVGARRARIGAVRGPASVEPIAEPVEMPPSLNLVGATAAPGRQGAPLMALLFGTGSLSVEPSQNEALSRWLARSPLPAGARLIVAGFGDPAPPTECRDLEAMLPALATAAVRSRAAIEAAERAGADASRIDGYAGACGELPGRAEIGLSITEAPWVGFAAGSSTPSEQGRQAIARNAAFLAAHPASALLVRGASAAGAGAESERRPAVAARTERVAAALQALGIDKARLRIVADSDGEIVAATDPAAAGRIDPPADRVDVFLWPREP